MVSLATFNVVLLRPIVDIITTTFSVG